MSGNRTVMIVIGLVVFLCLCLAVISIALGGYFYLNQSTPVALATRALSAPSNPLPPPTQFNPNPPGNSSPAAGDACDELEEFDDQGYDHIRPGQPHPPYNSNPPTSGSHWADPQEWGIYDKPQVQEQLVHNLEHGGIVIQYNNLPAADLQRLLTFVRNDSHHIVVAPYPGLPGNVKIAWTAWTVLQNCRSLDLDALTDFIDEFRDEGPESVP